MQAYIYFRVILYNILNYYYLIVLYILNFIKKKLISSFLCFNKFEKNLKYKFN